MKFRIRIFLVFLFLLFLSIRTFCVQLEYDENGHLTKDYHKILTKEKENVKGAPAFVNTYGVLGVNYDVDNAGMPYILCDQLNTTCKGHDDNCVQTVKCFPERRTHKLGCMAVFVYNTTEVGNANSSTVPTGSAMLKGCWSHDESELRECEEADECVAASTRKTGAEGRAAKFCCCRTHRCNQNLTFYSDVLPKAHVGKDDGPPDLVFFDNVHWMSRILMSTDFFAVSAVLLFLIFCLFISCVMIWVMKKGKIYKKEDIKLETCVVTEDMNSEGTVEITNEGSALLGSQADGLKEELINNAHRATLLGTGHFAQLYRSEIGHTTVAYRVYHNSEVDFWMNEQEIYSVKCLRRHENIVKFLAAFKTKKQLWLVTQYYPMGSICDFLEVNVPTVSEILKMASTMLNGLSYLHEEFHVDGYLKPTVVHRDFKSKKVLLKADLTACIGDFNLSVKCENGRVTNEENQSQVGTRRYMSPEVLEGATEFTGFAFQQIDVYAAGLVVWELLSRVKIPERPDEPIPDFLLPYELEIGATATLGQLRDLVVMQKYRPRLRECLRENSLTNRMVKTVKDMWDGEPDGRITSSCGRDRMTHYYEVSIGKASLHGMPTHGPFISSAGSSLHSLEGTRTDSSYGCPSATGTTVPVGNLHTPSPSDGTESMSALMHYT